MRVFRGGICASIPPSTGGEWSRASAPKVVSRVNSRFQHLYMDTAAVSQHLGGCSVTRRGSNNSGDMGKQGAWATCLSPTTAPSSVSRADDAHSAIPRESSSRWSEAHFLAMQQLKTSLAKRTETPEESGQEEWGRFPQCMETSMGAVQRAKLHGSMRGKMAHRKLSFFERMGWFLSTREPWPCGAWLTPAPSRGMLLPRSPSGMARACGSVLSLDVSW